MSRGLDGIDQILLERLLAYERSGTLIQSSGWLAGDLGMAKTTLSGRLRKLEKDQYLVLQEVGEQKKIPSLDTKGRELISDYILPLDAWLPEQRKSFSKLMKDIDKTSEGVEEENEEALLTCLMVGVAHLLRAIVALPRFPDSAIGLVRIHLESMVSEVRGEVATLKQNTDLVKSLKEMAGEHFPVLERLEKEYGISVLKEIGL